MKHAVQIRPVEKSKIDRFVIDVGEERVEVQTLGARRIAHVVGNPASLQMIEDVRADIQSTGLERVFFLGEIEQRDVFEGNVVEIEVAAKFKMNLEQLRKPVPEKSPARQRAGKPPQVTQAAKRRMRWIVNEIAPVAMRRRPASGQ